ncbi:MAG: hypothetical protein LC746_17150, partial [Acidobacteria bacterium]|nr:hypothetical protein [Acidobacteriota bacterium]
MKQSCIRLACALALALTAVVAARADIRVKKTVTISSQGAQQQGETGDESGGRAGAAPEFTTEEMIKGQRKRTEQLIQFAPNVPGIKRISIEQCDLKRTLDVSEATKKYYVTPIGGVDETNTGDDAATAGSGGGAGRVTRGGVVTMTRAVTDTGERKQMFGFTARHLKTRTTMQPSPDACQKQPFIMEQDGWYIDLEVNFECLVNEPPPQRAAGGRPGGCQDRFVYRNTGAGRLGYALEETTRTYAADGKTVQSEMTTRVTELTRATLDPALFDIPAGYQQARSQSELYDQRAMMQAMMQAQGGSGENEGGNPSSGGAASGGMNSMPSVPNAGTVGAKQPGAIRVGVVRVGNKTTQSVDAGNMRSTLIASIIESGVEAVPLEE